VLIDPGRLEQVLLNLVVNARDAMPDGGQVTLRSRPYTVTPEEARERELEPGPAVALEVEDQGTGMTQEVLARIFEPFFTTKEAGRGTGLGLATTDGIVRQAGGAIAVDSTPGKGTLFRVIFPRHDGPVLATVPAAPRVQRGGTETVLLVEDEAAIRALAARSLRLAGYQVLEAARGDIALAVARAHQGEIALLVTDVVLPGGGGQGVAATLLAERPRMKVLYVSGYSEHVLLPQAGQAAAFLPKPYKPEALLERARAVLDETLAA
jgi:CheY-like chemotaxis protein